MNMNNGFLATNLAPGGTAPAAACSRGDNLLLAALPEPERRQLSVSLDRVSVHAGQTLCGAGIAASHAWFPIDCVVSLMYLTLDGCTAEVAVVGNEGMVGAGLFVGGSAADSEAVVRCPGPAYRIKLSLLREYFNRSTVLRDQILRFLQVMLTQSAQIALCNRHHTVEQQLCRWLLTTADRAGSDGLLITHELIATTLGVRRAGITEAACRLQREGLIRYRRGRLELLDRARLENRSCECYGVLKAELERALPQTVKAEQPRQTRYPHLVAANPQSAGPAELPGRGLSLSLIRPAQHPDCDHA